MYFLWLQSGEGLMQEKPECREQIAPILSSLQEQWDELEGTTKSKAERLFDANRAVIDLVDKIMNSVFPSDVWE